MRGLFITFEGIDKSGKSTQARLLSEGLARSGIPALSTSQPGGSPVSAEIARLIRDVRHFGRMAPTAELMLYLADRAQHVHETIAPAIASGKVVVCDRYTDSTVAYQGYGRGLSLERLAMLNDIATGGAVPDLTFLVDIPVEEAFRRGLAEAGDRMEMEEEGFFNRVRMGYLRVAEESGGRVQIVDGLEETERLSGRIRTRVEALLAGRGLSLAQGR